MPTFDADAFESETSFSGSSAGWVSTKSAEDVLQGKISAEQLLTRERERRQEPPPTPHEVESFAADPERQSQESREQFAKVTAPFGAQMRKSIESTRRLAQGLKMDVTTLPTWTPSQIAPAIRNPVVHTARAIRDLEEATVAQQQMTVAVLEKSVTNAERSDKRSTVILVSTAMIALATLVVTLFAWHL